MFTGNDLPGLGGFFAFLVGIGVVIGAVGYWVVSWIAQHVSVSMQWN